MSPAPTTVPDGPSFDESLAPPRGGLPLAAVLGVTIAAVVALLLGGLTALQLRRAERNEFAARRDLLAESLAPLASEIERATDLAEIEQILSSTVVAEIARGHWDFNLSLSDGDGQVVVSAVVGTKTSPPTGSIQAWLPVRSAVLESGHGTLTVWQDDAQFAAEMAGRRHSAWLDIGATVLVIILVVQLFIFLLVTRPLNLLLIGIEKVEQGYPVRLPRGDIARELRWLSWRFQLMSANLTNSARLLVAAHLRAREISSSRPRPEIDPVLLDPLHLDRSGHSDGHDIIRRYLRSRAAQLEGYRPGDPAAREVALQVWDHDAVEAEIHGEMALRASLENSALTILDPVAFHRLDRQLHEFMEARAGWSAATGAMITAALARDGVPLVAIQHRAKHTAGVWRKMAERGLRLEDVSDLLAFRLIVPGRDDCYLALDAVHRLFEPEPFRFKDYIADPKANGYRSLHTSVSNGDGFVFEVQIRSVDMHRTAEEGAAAHWRYRAGKSIRR